jgi:hypothetical protein
MEISRIRRFSPKIGGIDDRRTKEKRDCGVSLGEAGGQAN